MDKGECPLCLGECEVGSFKNGGAKYFCSQCLRFAFPDDYTNDRVHLFLRDREAARRALQGYIKNHQLEDGYLRLTWAEIGTILKQARVSVEGLAF